MDTDKHLLESLKDEIYIEIGTYFGPNTKRALEEIAHELEDRRGLILALREFYDPYQMGGDLEKEIKNQYGYCLTCMRKTSRCQCNRDPRAGSQSDSQLEEELPPSASASATRAVRSVQSKHAAL